MIDVPILVKDALRDGRRLKNYKFMVLEKQVTRNITYMTTFDTNNRQYTTGISELLYVHIEASEPTATVTGRVNFPNSGYLPISIAHTQGTETFEAIGQFRTGSVIDFSAYIGPVFPEIGLTAEALITYTTSYVDDFLIDNNNLVTESVKFDERMASGDTLKFGLSEGASLEFQYFDKPNINGRRIRCEIDVQYDAEVEQILEPNDLITITQAGRITFFYTPSADATERITWTREQSWTYSITEGDPATVNCQPGDTLRAITKIGIKFEDYKPLLWHTIPMGYYDVAQCPMQYSTGIYKPTAYNKLKSEYLDAKANTAIEGMISDVGIDDEITIQTVMDLLLDGYAIEQQTDEVSVTALNQEANEWITYDDWTFKYVGDSTSRKVALCCTTKLMNQNAYDGGGPEFMDKRLQFDLDNYIRALQENFYNFKAYVYANIQDPDAFMATLKAKAPKQLGMSVSSSGGLGFRRFLLSDAVPDGNEVSTTIHAYPIAKLKYLQAIPDFYFHFLNKFGYATSGSGTATYQYAVDFTVYNKPHIYKSDIDSVGSITIHRDKLADVTLRDIIGANFELKCQYGKLDRVTDLFRGVELNNQWLFPRVDLYPANNLYPGGGLTSASAFRSTYSKLWTDSAGEQSFRNLLITYKTLDENDKEVEFSINMEINPDGTIDYDLTGNWLFKNLIWTEENVYTYASAMVNKLKDVHWIPFEMWGAGLPFAETGDEIEIIIGQNTYTSYVLQRQLNGVQNLQDTYINGTLDIF